MPKYGYDETQHWKATLVDTDGFYKEVEGSNGSSGKIGHNLYLDYNISSMRYTSNLGEIILPVCFITDEINKENTLNGATAYMYEFSVPVFNTSATPLDIYPMNILDEFAIVSSMCLGSDDTYFDPNKINGVLIDLADLSSWTPKYFIINIVDAYNTQRKTYYYKVDIHFKEDYVYDPNNFLPGPNFNFNYQSLFESVEIIELTENDFQIFEQASEIPSDTPPPIDGPVDGTV